MYNLSEEEIEALLKETEKLNKDNDQLEFDLTGAQDHIELDTCLFHTWELYNGLKESFYHCKICGEKKND